MENSNSQQLPPKRMVQNLRETFLPKLLKKFPVLQKKGLVFLYGSTALGSATKHSDVDVMVFLPNAELKARGNDLDTLAKEVWRDFNIDLVFNEPLELLWSDNAWNNDFVLYILTQAKSLHDPENILAERQKHFAKLPAEVRRDKIIFLGWEIIQTLVRIGQATAKSDLLSAVAHRAKLIKLNLALLLFLHGEVFDRHNLCASAKRNPRLAGFVPLVLECLDKINLPTCDDCLLRLVNIVNLEVIKQKWLSADFYSKWNPHTQPLRYGVWMKNL